MVFSLLGFLVALYPITGLCDTRNSLSNMLGALQATDCVQTAAFLRAPNTYERDPLAKPVAHSLPLCLVTAGALNLALRNAHGPKLWVLRAAIVLESALVINNNSVLVRIRTGK